jgi:hypothetical protein
LYRITETESTLAGVVKFAGIVPRGLDHTRAAPPMAVDPLFAQTAARSVGRQRRRGRMMGRDDIAHDIRD